MMQSFSKKKKEKTQIRFNDAMHDHWATDSLRPIREKLCHPYDFKFFTEGAIDYVYFRIMGHYRDD